MATGAMVNTRNQKIQVAPPSSGSSFGKRRRRYKSFGHTSRPKRKAFKIIRKSIQAVNNFKRKQTAGIPGKGEFRFLRSAWDSLPLYYSSFFPVFCFYLEGKSSPRRWGCVVLDACPPELRSQTYQRDCLQRVDLTPRSKEIAFRKQKRRLAPA